MADTASNERAWIKFILAMVILLTMSAASIAIGSLTLRGPVLKDDMNKLSTNQTNSTIIGWVLIAFGSIVVIVSFLWSYFEYNLLWGKSH